MFSNIYIHFAMLCGCTTFVVPNLNIHSEFSHTAVFIPYFIHCGIRFGDRDIDSRFFCHKTIIAKPMSKTTVKTSALVRFHAWLKSENQICSALCDERVTNQEMLGAFSVAFAFFLLPLFWGLPSLLFLLTSLKLLRS